MLKVYNTLTRKKEIFKPRKNKIVNIFVCGPTVYDFAHIGHARSYIIFDMITKYLRYKKYKVTYIQNITDIDDKIINRAKETGEDPFNLAKKFEKAYYEDMHALNVTAVDKYLCASKHIPEIIAQISRLLEKGYAYVAKDGVWFSVRKFKDYGKLSRQKPEELEKHRIEPSPYKKEVSDFALWKAQKSNEPAWDSPWGKGRPGWHIEDTAIAEKYFGPQYDIHGGGQDLIFPHHEAEIAQMEALSGKKPYVTYWLHNGLLLVNGKKMSKSLGNYITIREALKTHSPRVLRFFFALTHYRAPLNYSNASLENAKNTCKKLEEFVLRLKDCKGKDKSGKKVSNFVQKLINAFESAMDDDFNVASAIAQIFDFMKKINKLLDENKIGKQSATKILHTIYKIDEVLGFNLKEIAKEQKLSKEIRDLIEKRRLAREKKDFETADKIRADLAKRGIILEDLPDGSTRWKIVNKN
jgi:cysteinyl-tRNA synthetase